MEHYLYMKVYGGWVQVACIFGADFAQATGYLPSTSREQVRKLARAISLLFDRPVEIRFDSENANDKNRVVIDEF